MTCAECGFVHGLLEVSEISGRLRSFGARFDEVLAGADLAAASRRPEPAVWSAIEYACHVRDVLLVQRERVVLAQVEELPSFARMYRDERVSLCRYGTRPVSEVLGQLSMAADLCADVFGALDDDAWKRRVIYNWPSTAEHDLAWLGRHVVHEGQHHLMDVRVVLSRSAEAS